MASTLLFAHLWPLLFSSRRAGAFLVPLLYFIDLVWAFNFLPDYGLDLCFPIVSFFDLGILTNFGRDLSYSVGSVPPFLALFFSVRGPFVCDIASSWVRAFLPTILNGDLLFSV